MAQPPKRAGAANTARTVLVVSHEASRSGAPKVAIHLLRALREAGYRTVVVHRWGGPLETEISSAADSHMREPLRWLRVILRRWRPTSPLASRLELTTARWLIARQRPALVWCNTVVSWRYAEAASRSGVSSILYAHEQSDWSSTLPETFGAPEHDAHQQRAQVALVACSSSAADILSRSLRRSPAQIRVLHSPVETRGIQSRLPQKSHEPDETALVVACGAANPGKGFDVFVEAATIAAAQGVSARWRWVGAPPVDAAAVPPTVELAGEVDDAAREIARATVFVCPSRADSFPLVVLEAMALGRPIVASAIPGICEQLADTGRLIEPGNSSALASEVCRLLEDPGERESLGSLAHDRCLRLWDIGRFSEQVAQLASSAIGDGAHLE